MIFIECGAFLDGTSLFDCPPLGFLLCVIRLNKLRKCDPFNTFYIRCYRIGVVCGGRHAKTLDFYHVGGDRDGTITARLAV